MQIYLQYMRAINQKQKIIEQFKETEDSRNCYQNKVDKVYFQHDMAYGDFEDLPRRTVPDEILRDKVFNIAKNPKYDEYQRYFASMVWFFEKK